MKIKFNSNDDLPLNKTPELRYMIIVVWAVFHKTTNITLRFSLMNVCINCKYFILIEMMFLKELMLIRQKSAIFVSDNLYWYWYW